MDDLDLSIVLPAYEEADNLEILLPLMNRMREGLGISSEVLIVDASPARDATPEICRRNNVTCLPRTGGSQYGDAVRTGIAAARGSRILLMDADGSHSPLFIPQMWVRRQDADLIIASRYVRGGHTENPLILILMSYAVNIVFRMVLRLKCADISTSFKLYKSEQLKPLTLECSHFDIVEEILVKLSFTYKQLRILEIPFTFEKRQAGKTKRKLVAFAFGYLHTLLRLYAMKQATRKGLRQR